MNKAQTMNEKFQDYETEIILLRSMKKKLVLRLKNFDEADEFLRWLAWKGYDAAMLKDNKRLSIKVAGGLIINRIQCAHYYDEANYTVHNYTPIYIDQTKLDVNERILMNFFNLKELETPHNSNKKLYEFCNNDTYSKAALKEYMFLDYNMFLTKLEQLCYIHWTNKYQTTFQPSNKFFLMLAATCKEENNYEEVTTKLFDKIFNLPKNFAEIKEEEVRAAKKAKEAAKRAEQKNKSAKMEHHEAEIA